MLNSKKNHYLCSALQMANNMKTRALLVILLMAICFIVKAADGTTTYNDKGVIDGEVGRIGKMPGTLHFTIPVTLAPDGTLKAAKGIEAGKMTMNIGLTRKLVTEDFTGSVRD